MDWIQAQSMARSGKAVKRGIWPITKEVRDNSGTLEVTDERLFTGPYIPSAEDASAADWAQVDETVLPAYAAVEQATEVRDQAQVAHDVAEANLDEAQETLDAATAAAPPLEPPPETLEGGGARSAVEGGVIITSRTVIPNP